MAVGFPSVVVVVCRFSHCTRKRYQRLQGSKSKEIKEEGLQRKDLKKFVRIFLLYRLFLVNRETFIGVPILSSSASILSAAGVDLQIARAMFTLRSVAAVFLFSLY